MLAIQPPPLRSKRTTPNLLPCAIKHNGPIPTHPRYWSPQLDTLAANTTTAHSSKVAKTSTSHFRGRKLRGRHIVLPPGYKGLILQKTDQMVPSRKPAVASANRGVDLAEKLRRMEEGDDYDDDEEVMDVGSEEEVDVKIMEEKASFDEIVIWGHESVPEDDDAFVKGVQEWIGFAEAMNSYNAPSET